MNAADINEIGANWGNGCASRLPVITQYIVANWRRVAEMHANELDTSQNGIQQLIRNGTTYLHADHLGSLSAVTSITGTKVAEQRYTPFGGSRSGTGSSRTDKLYTGQPLDGETGLYYYGARYYDGNLGRFTQPDTIVPEPGNPQDLNRYTYTWNNPLKYVDPSGFDPLDEQWRSEFKNQHSDREPDWYDVLIRLFSIAFPEEWDPSKFYDSAGYLRSYEDLERTLRTPGIDRNWANMPDTLARLAGWYKPDETEQFVRDVGDLFGGLQDRFHEHSMWAAVSNRNNPVHVWAYLRGDGLPENFIGTDTDANVHHWGWAFMLGYNTGYLAVAMNTAREISQGGFGTPMNIDSRADIWLGNRAAMMGVDVRGFGASPDTIRRLYRANILFQWP